MESGPGADGQVLEPVNTPPPSSHRRWVFCALTEESVLAWGEGESRDARDDSGLSISVDVSCPPWGLERVWGLAAEDSFQEALGFEKALQSEGTYCEDQEEAVIKGGKKVGKGKARKKNLPGLCG